MLPIQESIRDSPTSASPVVGLRVSALPSAHASRPSGPQSPLRGANNVIPPTTDSAAHSPRPSSKADAPHSELPAPGEIPPFSAGNSKAPASRVGAAGDGGAEGGSMGDLSRLRSGSPIAGGRTAAGGSDGVDGPETRPSRDRPATGCEASPPARPAVWRRPVVSSSVHAEARKGVARGAQPGVAKKASRFLEAFSRRSFGPLGRGKNRRAVASSAPREEELVGCLQIRVGIHTGPVAASTLGFRRSCLTLVGDTLVSVRGVAEGQQHMPLPR